MSENNIPLSEMVQTLRDELEIAQARAIGSNLQFTLDSVELELSVAITKSGAGKGGVKFWVIEAGGEYKHEDASTHKFKLTLKPAAPGSILVSGSVPNPPSER